MERSKNVNVYVNALTSTLGIQHLILITLFVITPVGIVYLYVLGLRAVEFQFSSAIIFLTVLVWFVLILIAAIFIIFNKYWTYKIITNDDGIRCIGLFKNIFTSWDQIKSLEYKSSGFSFGGRLIKLEFNNGSFFFQTTMKKKDEAYPKLSLRGNKMKWIGPNGEEKLVTMENCPLYIEIQNHI